MTTLRLRGGRVIDPSAETAQTVDVARDLCIRDGRNREHRQQRRRDGYCPTRHGENSDQVLSAAVAHAFV